MRRDGEGITDVPRRATKRGQLAMRRPLPPDVLAYRIPEAATRLGISKSTLWAMIAANKIEARKVGGSTVIRRVVLEDYINGAPIVKAAQ